MTESAVPVTGLSVTPSTRQCDRCGHLMRCENGAGFIAMVISASDTSRSGIQMAVPRHRVPFDYAVCFSCLLEAFGIPGNAGFAPSPEAA